MWVRMEMASTRDGWEHGSRGRQGPCRRHELSCQDSGCQSGPTGWFPATAREARMEIQVPDSWEIAPALPNQGAASPAQHLSNLLPPHVSVCGGHLAWLSLIKSECPGDRKEGALWAQGEGDKGEDPERGRERTCSETVPLHCYSGN